MTSPPLSPSDRDTALLRMATEEFDVLVVGAGVVGAGAALDAATRGLKVALVEARDYAAGTSSRSSKLFHGGLRYLEQLDFGLVFEALRERALTLHTLCPHLARPVPFIYPITSARDRAYAGLGLAVYDVMGAGRGVPAHVRYLSQQRTVQSFPSADPNGIKGAYRFYEGVVDDARHTLFLVRTARAHGAVCATNLRVDDPVRAGEQVTGMTATDLETGERLRIRARTTVIATGVWTDKLRERLGVEPPFRVRPSKGVHLVVPRHRIDCSTGLVTRTEKSLLFLVPWDGYWIIGTTDTAWALDLAHPAATRSDIDYVLRQVNALLAEPLTHDDIVGVYAGLRPLLDDGSTSTTRASREHAVARVAPGLTMVAGGKYTTYRVIAQEAIDTATADLLPRVTSSRTHRTPLAGADGITRLREDASEVSARSGLPLATVERLLGRYGSLIEEVLALIGRQPDLGTPLAKAEHYLRAEVHYAASHEGARHLDDVLSRRTRISIEARDRGCAAAPEAAAIVAPVLGWDDDRRVREVRLYRQRVEAELESHRHHDDLSANTARLRAPDSRGTC